MRPAYPIGPFPLFINNFCIRLVISASGEIPPVKVLAFGSRVHLERRKPGAINYQLPRVGRFSDCFFYEEGVAAGGDSACRRLQGNDYFRIMAATGYKTLSVFKRSNTVSQDEFKAPTGEKR
jgi:hypothetical protein